MFSDPNGLGLGPAGSHASQGRVLTEFLRLDLSRDA